MVGLSIAVAACSSPSAHPEPGPDPVGGDRSPQRGAAGGVAGMLAARRRRRSPSSARTSPSTAWPAGTCSPRRRRLARPEPLPVVVDLHGLGEGASIEAATTQFSPKAQADDFIAVFPEGTGSPVGWDIDPSTSAHPNHDIDFMNALLDTLEAHQCVDESRIYSTGLSDGALFTSLLACTMANRFAAFAPVAGVV